MILIVCEEIVVVYVIFFSLLFGCNLLWWMNIGFEKLCIVYKLEVYMNVGNVLFILKV